MSDAIAPEVMDTSGSSKYDDDDILGGKSLMMSDSDDNNDDDDGDIIVKSRKSTKSKPLQLEDSEEEEDENIKESTIAQKSEIAAIAEINEEGSGDGGGGVDDDDNDNNDLITTTDSIPSPKEQTKKAKKKISAIIDTDSEDESLPATSISDDKGADEATNSIKSKLQNLVDSETESETSDAEEETTTTTTAAAKKEKPMRASAKKALNEMQTIQSEQQRLHREAHISVPYHQPKPRSLQEFLSRRTINQPLATAQAGGSPMPRAKQPRQSLGLRMNAEDLEAYAKLMEERAKEATEFFKAESDHDDDDDEEDEEQLEKDDKEDCPPDDNKGILEESEQPPVITAAEANDEEKDLPEIELNSKEDELQLPEQPALITEVVELPKLDMRTLNITPSTSKPATPRITEALRKLKMEMSNEASPSLKGDANMVIDLETGDMFTKKPTGVDDLLTRMMKTREPKKQKIPESVNILTAEHGKLELSKVAINLHDEEPIFKEEKPGAAYMKMQAQLKELIAKKRMEDLRKKQAEEEEHIKCLGDDDEEENNEDDDDEMDVDMEEESEGKEKSEKKKIYNEDEEIEEVINEEEDEENVEEEIADEEENDEEENLGLIDDAAVESENEENENEESENEESEDSDDDDEPEVDAPSGKRKNRIITAFQNDDDDSDNDVDLLQTPKPNNSTKITATQLQMSAHKLFDVDDERRTGSDEENELLGLCSGKFTQTQTQKPGIIPTDALMSQVPITQQKTDIDGAEELQALCSGTFETQQPATAASPVAATPKGNKILSSDEEEKSQQVDKSRVKKLTKKMKKKTAKLGFSDDEETDNDEQLGDEEVGDEEVGEVEEIPETFIDYDSEENEIVVEMTKKDKKIRAANFVENEAELSESEWGSADEDEKNLDDYDIELGDEDEFDKEKLRSELEQIHARKMLDQDIREVRQIKEMLFEEEDGAVRQRQFRWKNAESGFSLDATTTNADGAGDGNGDGSGDEENERQWRQIRFEREQLLREKGLKTDASGGNSSPLTPANSSNVTTIRKLHIINSKKSTIELKKNSPFLISKTVTNIQQQQTSVRGSFLVRDKETLNNMIKAVGTSDVDGAAGTVSVSSSMKGKNFVFATLTEEEHENQKRKAAEILNSSTETGIDFMKRPRLEPRRDKCFIDQLL